MLNLLRQGVPAGALQEAGLGLLVALEQEQPGVADVATTAAEMLDERGWRGDRELADLLRSRAAGLDRGGAYPPIWSCSLRSWTATPIAVWAAI